jgi:hypothetical protein
MINPKRMICFVAVLFFLGLAASGTQAQAACSNADLSGKYLISGAGIRTELLNLTTLSVELDGYVQLNGAGGGTYKIVRQQDATTFPVLTGGVTYAIGSNCEGTLTLQGAGFEGPANNLAYSTIAEPPGPNDNNVAPELILEDMVTGHDMTVTANLNAGTCPAALHAESVALSGRGGMGGTQDLGGG